MNHDNTHDVKKLSEKILAKRKYTHIHKGLIEFIVQSELGKGRKKKETEKAVLSKLHQVGAAYFAEKPDYAGWTMELSTTPHDLHTPQTKDLCTQIMKSHFSTEERLPILADFYGEILAEVQPIQSILDLACGLNPLALPWMPVEENISYYGCDIFSDMVKFLDIFRKHFGIDGEFKTCNLLDAKFDKKVEVAFLLKTLPCLEQLQKGFVPDLLERIPANFLLLSYPISSLSGRSKGMRETYSDQFNEIISKKGWEYKQFEFSTELAFLVNKS